MKKTIQQKDTKETKQETWLFASHYHCKSCGTEMKIIYRLPWRVAGGVAVVGICPGCHYVLVERENKRHRWSRGLKFALRDWLL